MNASTTITTTVTCDCGCGEAIDLAMPGGFAGTTCEVQACSTRRAASGMVSFTIRRSDGFAFRPVGSGTVSHRDGLVSFG